MNKHLHFIHDDWLLPTLAIAFLLVLLFVWKEWKGKFNRLFLLNSVVGVIAVFTLFFLFLRPTWFTEVSGSAVLLTEGYSFERLDSIKKSQKFIKTIDYSPGVDLSASLDSVNEVTILGQGIRNFDFRQLVELSTTYIQGNLPKGIVKLKYQKEHRLGNKISVRGLYRQPVLGNQLMLQSSSGDGLDSMVFDAKNKHGFSFDVNPKTTGKFVYQLVEKDSAGTILNMEPLPVEVSEKQVLRIFISNRYPSFETKYLKNFLAEEGHELVVRSQITKGRYKFEYFNTASSPVYGFAEKELKKFDLLILDTDTFLSLSKSTRQTVTKLVKEFGAGIFIQPNETLFKTANRIVDFGFISDGKNKVMPLNRPELELEKYPYIFKNTNAKGIVLENYGYGLVMGMGKLSTTVLTNTYQLILDGNSLAYREIWSKIIEVSSRPQEATGIFETSEPFAFKDTPYPFKVRTELEKPVVFLADGSTLPLIKDAFIEDTWHGKTYPVQNGWQSISMQNDTSLVMNYFVMDTVHWKSLIGVKTILENSWFFKPSGKEELNKRMAIELNRWWFFLLFIICMVYLWILPKLKP